MCRTRGVPGPGLVRSVDRPGWPGVSASAGTVVRQTGVAVILTACFLFLGATAAASAHRTTAGARHFGKMFPSLPLFRFSAQAAADLVATMEDSASDPAGIDRGSPEDSHDLPSQYT